MAFWAQGNTSRVLGTVLDASGAAVPNTSVKRSNEDTRVTFEAKTSDAGTYAFEAVQPGSCSTVEAGGFRKYTSRSNPVNIGQAGAEPFWGDRATADPAWQG